MILLGIDFGLQKIGLSFADSNFAEPLMVLPNDAKTITKLVNLCQQKEINKLVIGRPEGILIPQLENFAEVLRLATGLPFVWQDETLTSHDALVKMREAGKSRQSAKAREDAVAAALILQDYINSQPKEN